MALSREEIKTIAITSAVAAAATAMASAGIAYVVEKMVARDAAQAGPTFVVVPVVQQELPPDLPLAGYGYYRTPLASNGSPTGTSTNTFAVVAAVLILVLGASALTRSR